MKIDVCTNGLPDTGNLTKKSADRHIHAQPERILAIGLGTTVTLICGCTANGVRRSAALIIYMLALLSVFFC